MLFQGSEPPLLQYTAELTASSRPARHTRAFVCFPPALPTAATNVKILQIINIAKTSGIFADRLANPLPSASLRGSIRWHFHPPRAPPFLERGPSLRLALWLMQEMGQQSHTKEQVSEGRWQCTVACGIFPSRPKSEGWRRHARNRKKASQPASTPRD